MHNVTSDVGAIILYKSKSGNVSVDVTLQDETVWLSQKQISDLFDTTVANINIHMKNLYREGELVKKATIKKSLIVQKEGKREVKRTVEFYNLDAIISLGYRVNSKRATDFRVWATSILRDHLIHGYTLNQKRLQTKKHAELHEPLTLIQSIIQTKELDTDEAKGLLEVITDYTKSWLLFAEYDADSVPEPSMRKGKYVLKYADALDAIQELKNRQNSTLFGQERGSMLDGIIGNIYQTFDQQELYATIEEKAAHLLYFVIKDHPFIDGNKRIGSLLFLVYLKRNAAFWKKSGERTFNDAALVALALLIAESKPAQKDSLLRLIMHFVSR